MTVARARRARRTIGLIAAFLLIAALAACSSSGSSGASGSSSGKATLQLWLGGDFTGATPGSSYLKWVDTQISRFEAANPGDKVQVTLLPVDNSQLAAKVDAAFASGQVPDLMVLYTGAYTTDYVQDLMSLNSYVDKTSGFYNELSNWDLSCNNYDCDNGHGSIFGIPISGGTYVLFYNKALFKKAGISAPPATYQQWYADCAIFNKMHILPVSYGDLDGYDTSNVLTTNLVSTLPAGGIQDLLSGKMKYTSSAVVNALTAVDNLAAGKQNCMSQAAFTTAQYNGTNEFIAGKAAMATFYSALLTQFEKSLGSNLGVARQPVSGNGPLLHVNNGYAGDSFDNWVIPKGSPHAALAWKFITLASDASAQESLASEVGLTPVNRAAIATLNPIGKFIANLSVDPAITELDQAMPTPVALEFYRELHLAFDGQETAEQAMANVQQTADSYIAQHG